MADIDFYSRNLHRRYPLIDESYGSFLNDDERLFSQIVDSCFVFYPFSKFDPTNSSHKVFISKYNGLSNNSPELTFLIIAPGSLIDQKSITVINEENTDFNVVRFNLFFSDSSNELNQPLGEQIGFGFVVFGRTDSFEGTLVDIEAQLLANPDQYSYLERRCIQVPIGHFIRKIEVANEPRTRVPDQILSSSSGIKLDYLKAPGSPVNGEINFVEGYNCQIKVLPNLNAIRFSAKRGAGKGEACTEIPRTDEEIALQAEGKPLDNALRCNEVLTNINGIEPDLSGNFNFEAGHGIEIVTDQNQITIRAKDDLEGCG